MPRVVGLCPERPDPDSPRRADAPSDLVQSDAQLGSEGMATGLRWAQGTRLGGSAGRALGLC